MKGPGRYTKEFKLEAIRLLNSGDKPVSEIAMELGVKRTLLYRWTRIGGHIT
jgi:transposase-like protein